MNQLDSFEAFKSLVHSETLGALRSGDVEKIVLTMQTMGSSNVGFAPVDGPFECSVAMAARQIVSERW
jgi:hypothetical protein